MVARAFLADWLLDQNSTQGDREADCLRRMRRLDRHSICLQRHYQKLKPFLTLAYKSIHPSMSNRLVSIANLEEVGAVVLDRPRTYLWAAVFVQYAGFNDLPWHRWSRSRYRTTKTEYNAVLMDRRDATMLWLW